MPDDYFEICPNCRQPVEVLADSHNCYDCAFANDYSEQHKPDPVKVPVSPSGETYAEDDLPF